MKRRVLLSLGYAARMRCFPDSTAALRLAGKPASGFFANSWRISIWAEGTFLDFKAKRKQVAIYRAFVARQEGSRATLLGLAFRPLFNGLFEVVERVPEIKKVRLNHYHTEELTVALSSLIMFSPYKTLLAHVCQPARCLITQLPASRLQISSSASDGANRCRTLNST